MAADDEDGGLTTAGFTYVIEKKFNAKVKGKWSQKEIKTLYDTLHAILTKFDGNIRAFKNAFGALTFKLVGDNALGGGPGQSNLGNNTIYLTHWSLPWAGEPTHYGSPGWAIAHEMGHFLDMKAANGDPNLYFSNVFVDTLNGGGCEHLGPNGCLGTNPDFVYRAQNLFQGKSDYQPSGKTTVYGRQASSTEDYAESFAAYVLNDPNDMVDDQRKFIIQVDIAVMVSSSH